MTARLNAYLLMDGNAKEAIAFYERVLEAKVLALQSFGQMPSSGFPMPEEAKGRVAHAALRVGESDLMISDSFPGQPVRNGNRVSVSISVGSKEKGQAIFDALTQNGEVHMPFQQTFFSPGYGMVSDRFGVMFHVNTEGT